jgi:hypothetical protein
VKWNYQELPCHHFRTWFLCLDSNTFDLSRKTKSTFAAQTIHNKLPTERVIFYN